MEQALRVRTYVNRRPRKSQPYGVLGKDFGGLGSGVGEAYGGNKPELTKIVKLTRENTERLLEVWNEYFSQ